MKYTNRNDLAKVWTIGAVEGEYTVTFKEVVTPNNYSALEWSNMLQTATIRCGRFASAEALKKAEAALVSAERKYNENKIDFDTLVKARERREKAGAYYEAWHDDTPADGETNHLAFLAVIGHGLVSFPYSLTDIEGRLYRACIESATLEQSETADTTKAAEKLESVKEYMIKALTEAGVSMNKISKKRAIQLVFEVGEKIVRKGAGFATAETKANKFLHIWSKYVLYLAGVQMIEEKKPTKNTLSF